MRATFKNGRLDGPMQLHDEAGCVERELTFKDGRLDGAVRLFDQDKVVRTMQFDQGEWLDDKPAEATPDIGWWARLKRKLWS